MRKIDFNRKYICMNTLSFYASVVFVFVFVLFCYYSYGFAIRYLVLPVNLL